jgi:hypothetical protein
MYLENIILQVTNSNTWKISTKALSNADLRKETRETPITSMQMGAKHHGEAILVQPMACHAKVVVKG